MILEDQTLLVRNGESEDRLDFQYNTTIDIIFDTFIGEQIEDNQWEVVIKDPNLFMDIYKHLSIMIGNNGVDSMDNEVIVDLYWLLFRVILDGNLCDCMLVYDVNYQED